MFSISFYKKRTALYLNGKIKFTNKTASFASYVDVLFMFTIIIVASSNFGDFVDINEYILSNDHDLLILESV